MSKLGIEILPAILPKSYTDLHDKLLLIEDVASLVQVDVVDGAYAPNKTWPYTQQEQFARIVAGDEGMPLWESIDFEFDLMVYDALEVIEDYVHAGATRIIVHSDSHNAHEALELLYEKYRETFEIEVGLAVRADTAVVDLEVFRDRFDYIQVMGIEKVGFQGQKFSIDAVQLLRDLRLQYPEIVLQVDGGVTAENISMLSAAGANRLVVGSAIFGHADPAQALRRLQKL